MKPSAGVWTLAALFGLLGSVAASHNSPSGRLLVTWGGSRQLLRYDPAALTEAGTFGSPEALNRPQAAAVTPWGDLLVVNSLPRHVVVEQTYRWFLNRHGEAGGQNSWTDVLGGPAVTPYGNFVFTPDLLWCYFQASDEGFAINGNSITPWMNASLLKLTGRAATPAEVSSATAFIPAETTRLVNQGMSLASARWFVRIRTLQDIAASAEAKTYLSSKGLDVDFPATNEIRLYDGKTGAAKGVFATLPDSDHPYDLLYHPSGLLLVTSPDQDRVLALHGVTGKILGDLTNRAASGIDAPLHMALDGGGVVWVSGYNNDAVFKIDFATGAAAGRTQALSGDTFDPEGIAFGPDGKLYVSSFAGNRVERFEPTTGAHLGAFTTGGDLKSPKDLLFLADGRLLVTSYFQDRLALFDGGTGAYQADLTPSTPLLHPTHLQLNPTLSRSLQNLADQLRDFLSALVATNEVPLTAGSAFANRATQISTALARRNYPEVKSALRDLLRQAQAARKTGDLQPIHADRVTLTGNLLLQEVSALKAAQKRDRPIFRQ